MSKNKQKLAPPSIVEMSLIERFHWTPKEISSIPYKLMQKLFIISSAKDDAEMLVKATAQDKAENQAKNNRSPLQKRGRTRKKFSRNV